MRFGKSDKSGENGYLDRHHIIPKRFRKTKEDEDGVIDLSLDEHREIHHLSNSLENRNDVISTFFHWFKK